MEEKNFDETNCKYVGSRGILKHCDIHALTPRSSYPIIEGDKYTNAIKHIVNPITGPLYNKCKTIYICTSALPQFILTYFKNIDYPFILVTGDCDITCSESLFRPISLFNEFISNPLLKHWFCQNWIGRHPKVSGMPIGQDYHTMTLSQQWGNITSVEEQERELLRIRHKSPVPWQRPPLCYCNFQFALNTKYAQDRRNAMKNIKKELCFYEPNKVSRFETWERQSNYAFVISPHGGGLDCYRTWEALVLGCIPIVKTSPIDYLYQNLPVVIVKNWSDISINFLTNQLREIEANWLNNRYDFSKLEMQYWKDKIDSFKT